MQKKECVEIFERYILNQANEDEVNRLSQWIQTNKEITFWLEQQILNSSSIIDNEVQLRMLRNIQLKIDNENSDFNVSVRRKIGFQINRWLRVAALIFLPMLSAAGMYYYMSDSKSATNPLIVTVDRGQKANILLPDGTKVWLNSQSKLTYSDEFNDKKRLLHLDGEAYFEVAHNPDKPFIVVGCDIVVEALGTAFGVKAYKEDNLISSILMKGKVRVSTADGSLILMPNDRVIFDKTTKKMVQSKVVNAKDFTGWIHDELRFENESLDDIVKCIQRIYNVEILFASESLKHQRYSGTVSNNSLESILNIISLTSPITFERNINTITLYENKKIKDKFLN